MRNLRIIRKRRIAFLLSSLCCVCAFFGADLSGAWFVTGGSFGSMTAENADVRYLPTLENETPAVHGKLIDGSAEQGQTVFLVPGSNLISEDAIPGVPTSNYPGKLMMENFSTVPTEVRVVVNCMLSTDGTELTEIPLEWQQGTGTGEYYYGKNDDSGRYMPMLKLTFANPAGYGWQYSENTAPEAGMVDFTTCWNLQVGGSSAVPAVSAAVAASDVPGTGVPYDVLTALTLVGVYEHDSNGDGDFEDALDVSQEQFDAYFSSNFAGNTLTLEIVYYAKQQQYMSWNVFSRQFITLAP